MGPYRFEVINAGVPAYDTWQEWQLLRRIGLQLNPDLVLIGFFIGNDIGQNGLRSQANNQIIEEKEEAFYDSLTYGARLPLPFKTFLVDHSEAYRFFRERYHRLLQMIQIRQKPTEGDVWWLDQYRKDLPTGQAIGYTYTDTLLTNIVKWVIQRDTRLALLLIPERGQVEPEHWVKTIGDIIVFDPTQYDLTKPNQWLLEYSTRMQIPVIDLLPRYKAIVKPEKLYFDKDTHWTSTGQQVAAKAVFQFIKNNNLLDRIQ
jgi:hypothetical protein